MALFKCKMCGGDLEVSQGTTVAECEYCGTKQTLPKINEEVIQNLFNRANALRLKCEFDKAEQIYEKILQENDAESEAHWGIVLCKYGIEYVEDPKTYKRIPTCHRTSYDAVTADADYLAAVAHADPVQRSIYEAEAKAIDEIQKNILSIVKDEKPFDVFLCYKETDETGKRTIDSTIANDIYYQLTQEGLKVFYAAITLEDKLGQEYEPYIFAALNSSKVMLVIGTKPQYFTAVWVKNEWSRFLKLMKSDRSKLLIPCYKDMDAYELPEEFAHLQAQDMSKIGFINDVVRGIKKVTVKDEPKATVVKETVVTAGNANTAPLLKRAFMFLEDGDWKGAEEYCEKVLDIDPECAQAYLGKLMADLRVSKQEDLQDCAEPFDANGNYQKAVRFADEKLIAALEGYVEHIRVRNENARMESIYNRAKKIVATQNSTEAFREAADLFGSITVFKDAAELARKYHELASKQIYALANDKMSNANTENLYKEAAILFESIGAYKDSSVLAQNCFDRAEAARKDAIYRSAMALMNQEYIRISLLENAIESFKKIPGWKDADDQIVLCQQKIQEIEAKMQAELLMQEQRKELARQEAERIAKRNKKIAIISAPIVCAIIAFIIVLITVIIPNSKYNDAIALMDAGNIVEAYEALVAMDGYKDSAEKADSLYGQYKIEKLKNVQVGDHVFFGSYEQDTSIIGKEYIEWLVLDIQDGKALVISQYALDCEQYNISDLPSSWANCSLRKWLNYDFISAAFSTEEEAMIPTVTVSADENPVYDTDPGIVTQDQVFLLSVAEVNKYFNSDSARTCKPTDYAIKNGAYVDEYCRWWLRSPGYNQYYAAYVLDEGIIDYYGNGVYSSRTAVRPALWIDLSAI